MIFENFGYCEVCPMKDEPELTKACSCLCITEDNRQDILCAAADFYLMDQDLGPVPMIPIKDLPIDNFPKDFERVFTGVQPRRPQIIRIQNEVSP